MFVELIESVRANAPTALIGACVLGAALVTLIQAPRMAWVVAAACAIGSALVAFDWMMRNLLATSAAADSPEYDGVGLFAVPLVLWGAASAVLAAGLMLRDWSARAAPAALAMILFMGAGWSAALLASDLVSAFLASEAAWLAGVVLVALGGARRRDALHGAARMLLVGGVGAAIFLLGVALIGRSVGALSVAALPSAHIAAPAMAGLGVILIVAALALKGAIAPLHSWVGPAVSGASGASALAIGSIHVIGATALLIRIAAHAIQAPALGEAVSVALAALGSAALLIGSLQAIGAVSFRRLIAYAGIAQIGGALLSAALGSPAGFAAALVQLLASAAVTIMLIGGAAIIDARSLGALDGMGRRAPVAGAAIAFGALSLMGAPLTIGFLGRWRLIEAGVGADWAWAAAAAVAASLASMLYGGRIIQRLYFRRASEAYVREGVSWRLAMAPALALAAAVIGLGLAPAILLRVADRAAALLIGGVA